VWKDATKLFNVQKCSAAARNRSDWKKKLGGHGQDMGQRAIGRRNFIFALQKSKNC
jgi:hypothetical protein